MAGGRQGVPGFDPGRLRAARLAAGLSQGALAAAARVHVKSVEEWESGRQVPRVESVAALAEALRVSPSQLLEPVDGTAMTLQQLRAAAGRSQQQVADGAGMLRTTYSALERGETGLLADEAAAGLARALDVPVEQVRAAHNASRVAYLERRPHRNGGGRRAQREP